MRPFLMPVLRQVMARFDIDAEVILYRAHDRSIIAFREIGSNVIELKISRHKLQRLKKRGLVKDA